MFLTENSNQFFFSSWGVQQNLKFEIWPQVHKKIGQPRTAYLLVLSLDVENVER